MTIFELGALGEFVGSIAVVVTLIYLALQIRQNTSRRMILVFSLFKNTREVQFRDQHIHLSHHLNHQSLSPSTVLSALSTHY